MDILTSLMPLPESSLRRRSKALELVESDDLVAPLATFVEMPFEKKTRLSQLGRLPERDIDDHHLVPVTIEELSALGVPNRIGAPNGRHLPLDGRVLKRVNVDLRPPGFIGLMRHPAPIR